MVVVVVVVVGGGRYTQRETGEGGRKRGGEEGGRERGKEKVDRALVVREKKKRRIPARFKRAEGVASRRM